MIAAGSYWYQTTASLCPAPVLYRLGNIDPSFTLSREEALAYVTQAERFWEDAVGRELFVYDADATLVIQFVYDDRQATADAAVMARKALDDQWQESEEVRTTLTALQTEYEALTRSYQEQVAAYEVRFRSYNDEVTMFNDRGGAPPADHERLAVERQALSAEMTRLDRLNEELAAMASQINRLAERGNALIDAYNTEVSQYNHAYGYTREFTQGDYQGDQINIYKFSDETELVTVLAHEFGHALGIGHVEGSNSLMYYLLEGSGASSALSAFDIAAFEAVCGYEETVAQQIRRHIRTSLAALI